MSLSKFASTSPSYPRDCLNEIPDEMRHITETVLYEFVDDKSEDDRELSIPQRATLHNSASQCIRKATSHAVSDQQVDVAVKVATVLKLRANEFNEKLQADEELNRMAKEAIEDTDGRASIPAAISHVTNVVRTLFECNEQGEAQNINIGSIAAIFAYCYTVCKSLVNRVLESHKMAGFLISLGSYLIASLVRAKFYEWLSSQGGWVRLLTTTVPSKFPVGGNNLLLVGGAVLIAMWAYNRFIAGR